MTDPIERIKQLGSWRAWRERGGVVKGDVASFARELRRMEKTMGTATDAWSRIAPPELQQCSSVETFRGGTLTLVVESSAAAFQVDRALRSGLEGSLRQAVPDLVRIRTRIGSIAQR